jgi:hypothetical protein
VQTKGSFVNVQPHIKTWGYMQTSQRQGSPRVTQSTVLRVLEEATVVASLVPAQHHMPSPQRYTGPWNSPDWLVFREGVKHPNDISG